MTFQWSRMLHKVTKHKLLCDFGLTNQNALNAVCARRTRVTLSVPGEQIPPSPEFPCHQNLKWNHACVLLLTEITNTPAISYITAIVDCEPVADLTRPAYMTSNSNHVWSKMESQYVIPSFFPEHSTQPYGLWHVFRCQQNHLMNKEIHWYGNTGRLASHVMTATLHVL